MLRSQIDSDMLLGVESQAEGQCSSLTSDEQFLWLHTTSATTVSTRPEKSEMDLGDL